MPFKATSQEQSKKKPPPRPPPPNLNKLKSKSIHNIHKKFDSLNLIDWSPPNSPRSESMPKFGGSVSSSFSSSTSSLASIKKSGDYECLSPATFSTAVWGSNTSQNANNSSTPVQSSTSNNNFISNYLKMNGNNTHSAPTASLFGPTIIRPRYKKKLKPDVSGTPHSSSLPMPTGPPPSPPKDASDVITPYGIALYLFPATQPGDLALEVDDVVILIRRVNKEWLYGQVDDREGIFPENFINIINPLPEDLR